MADPQRRDDDQVGPDGTPVSPAHAAIYRYIGQCRDELMADNDINLARVIELHERERHHSSLAEVTKNMGKTPDELMAEFVDAVGVSNRIVDALEGPKERTLTGWTRRSEDGLLHKVNSIEAEMRNGIKHKIEISKSQYALAASVVGALGLVAAAIMGGP